MARTARTSWSNPKVLVVFALLFLSGASVGAFGMRQYLHGKLVVANDVEVMEAAHRVGLQRLAQQLSLTPKQILIVTRELDEYAKYYQNIEEERADVAEHGKYRILRVLDDEQKRRFNEIFGLQQHRY